MEDDPTQQEDTSVAFGTGEIQGSFAHDKLCLGNSGFCTPTNFIVTTMETDQPFESCSFDGIMGLAFNDLSMGPGFNLMDDFVTAKSLPSNKFSVYLTDDGGSEITFGGYKKSQAASEPFWVPVSHESYWEVNIDDIAFDNVPKGLCKDCRVAVDTGTSMLAGPSDVIAELSSKLDLKSDCSNFDDLPLLGFQIGDRVLNLAPEDYVDKGDGSCELALMQLDVPPPRGPIFVFGDPFLRRFLTIYDKDGPQVGFALSKDTSRSDLLGSVHGGPLALLEDEQQMQEEEEDENLFSIGLNRERRK